MKVMTDRLNKLASTLLSFEIYPLKIRLNINPSSKRLGTGQKLEGGRAGAFLFWPTSFGETLPIPGAEKMLTPENGLHNLS